MNDQKDQQSNQATQRVTPETEGRWVDDVANQTKNLTNMVKVKVLCYMCCMQKKETRSSAQPLENVNKAKMKSTEVARHRPIFNGAATSTHRAKYKVHHIQHIQ